MPVLLQALARLVALKRLGVLLFVLVATLCTTTGTASAHERVQTKTRIRDFELAEHHSYGLSTSLSPRKASGKSHYRCPNSRRIHSYRWRDPSGRDASDVADWISRQSWIDELAPALASAGVASKVPPLVLVGEASLIAIEGINAIASLEAQRQSAAAIAKATSNEENECKDASTPVGRTGAQTNVQPGTNQPTDIEGRTYTGHALDQMQGRGVPPSVVENAIQNGGAASGNVPGTTTFYDPENSVTVVTDSASGRVITVRRGAP